MITYVSLDFIEGYLRETAFLQNGGIPYIAFRDMLTNAPKIDVEKIQARRSVSDDMPYAKDKDFEDYMWGSLVNDMSREICYNHSEFISKAENENIPFPMTKEYRIQMMIAKPHEITLSRELVEALNKEAETMYRGIEREGEE